MMKMELDSNKEDDAVDANKEEDALTDTAAYATRPCVCPLVMRVLLLDAANQYQLVVATKQADDGNTHPSITSYCLEGTNSCNVRDSCSTWDTWNFVCQGGNRN